MKNASSLRFLILATGTAALGGLLFGYDTAVVNGAIEYLRIHFDLTAAEHGWAASSALIGCIFGAALAGVLSDFAGRKRALLLTAFLFFVSAVFSAFPESLNQFVIARFIGGVGVGAASLLAPLYIAEISPAHMRGRLVSLYQLAIVSGIVVVFFVNRYVQGLGSESWNVDYGWRWMFGSEALPAFLFGFLLLWVPESPRWLIKKGRREQGLEIFSKVSDVRDAEAQVKAVEASLSNENSGSFRQLLVPPFRIAMIIGAGMAVFQQLSGINVIMYYSTSIFSQVGSSADTSFTQTIIIGVINFLFTVVALLLIDKSGRRKLLMMGIGVQLAALTLTGVFILTDVHPYWILASILVFVAAFASSSGPVVWVVISEIFPNKIRGRAMSVATIILWVSAYAVAQTFPIFNEMLGTAGTFGIYAIASFLSLIFVIRYVPETKNQTLESIEAIWMSR